MGDLLLPEEKANSTVIRKKGTPISTVGKIKSRKGFFRTIGSFLGLLHDYTAEDIDRLKEAGVQIVESKAKKQYAEAMEKIAKAAELHAMAEVRNAEAQKILADADMVKAETLKIAKETEIEYLAKYTESIERVNDAISKIKQKGGLVLFNKKQLDDLLKVGSLEFPNDKKSEINSEGIYDLNGPSRESRDEEIQRNNL
jgi:hypothetical protein